MRADEERINMSQAQLLVQHGCTGDGSCDFILTPPEIAFLLRVPASWVYQHKAVLPLFNIGRYVRCRCGGLRAFLRAHGGQSS
jgi:hypothetical protein